MLNILTTTMTICRCTSKHCRNLVLNKTEMIQIASFIIYTMHLSARLQTHHQPQVLLVNDIHAVLPTHVYEQPLPLLQFRLLPSHTLNIHTLLYMYVICQTIASEPALPWNNPGTAKSPSPQLLRLVAYIPAHDLLLFSVPY